jgi:hypothetical protein
MSRMQLNSRNQHQNIRHAFKEVQRITCSWNWEQPPGSSKNANFATIKT